MTFIRFYSPKLEIVCQYLAKWKTTSHYKIYPVHMAVLLISTISHDLPEVITLYFYIGCPPDFVFILNLILRSRKFGTRFRRTSSFHYTRYQPPSFDVRLTALIQPILAVSVAFISLFTQLHSMLQYQRLFKSRITKAIIFLSVLPIILVTPLIKISGKFFL